MEFRILGPLEALAGDEPVRLGGAKQKALLALLLLDANRVVPVDRLIDSMWGESPPETAAHAIQVYVSSLRKAFGGADGEDRLITRTPGYLVRVGDDELDLRVFEWLLARGRQEAASGEIAQAAATLQEALSQFRGAPLTDFGYEPFAQGPIARLEELRLTALEERVDVDLARGRHSDIVPELEALVSGHPLRERLRGQLIVALYRAGRQAAALDTYQDGRRLLVDELGIDPSPALQDLERLILNHDPGLAWSEPTGPARAQQGPERSVLAVARGEEPHEPLVALAEPLTRGPVPHELIITRLVEGAELSSVAGALSELGNTLRERGVTVRTAAFTLRDEGEDIVKLSSEQEVDLLLLPMPELGDRAIEGWLKEVLEAAPCDVALVTSGSPAGSDGPIVVPFGGGEHDWAALELAAWLSAASSLPLRLLGTETESSSHGRDASRLLATASLAVQQLVGVTCEPTLVAPGSEGVLQAVEDSGRLIFGLSERWREDGLGPTRADVLRQSQASALVVRRGVRPGGLTPREGLTRYTWSLSAHTGEA